MDEKDINPQAWKGEIDSADEHDHALTAEEIANVAEPKQRKYRVTYHGPDDQVVGVLEFEASELPPHDHIMVILEQHLPGRPRGGWYMMETI